MWNCYMATASFDSCSVLHTRPTGVGATHARAYEYVVPLGRHNVHLLVKGRSTGSQ